MHTKNINPLGDLRYEHDPNSLTVFYFCFYSGVEGQRSLGKKPWVFSTKGPFPSGADHATAGHLHSRHQTLFYRAFLVVVMVMTPYFLPSSGGGGTIST